MRIIKVVTDIELPDVPEAFTYGEGKKIQVGSIENSSLVTIGEIWTEELLKVAQRQRKERDAED